MPDATTATAAGRRLRADARRNHDQILAAARDVFVERGPEAPLEEVARRARVGIGTLYRRFTDRPALLRAVVQEALVATRRAAERALAEEEDAFGALSRYLHDALDLRVSAVIPIVLSHVDMHDEDLRPAREDASAAVQRIVDAAHADGTLSVDVTFADIGMLLVRLARPLPGPLPPDLNDRLAHRHLDLTLRGLRSDPEGHPPLAGPALTDDDLRDLTAADPGPAD